MKKELTLALIQDNFGLVKNDEGKEVKLELVEETRHNGRVLLTEIIEEEEPIITGSVVLHEGVERNVLQKKGFLLVLEGVEKNVSITKVKNLFSKEKLRVLTGDDRIETELFFQNEYNKFGFFQRLFGKHKELMSMWETFRWQIRH